MLNSKHLLTCAITLLAACEPFDLDLGDGTCWFGEPVVWDDYDTLLSAEGAYKLNGVCDGEDCTTANRIPTGTREVAVVTLIDEDIDLSVESSDPSIMTAEVVHRAKYCVAEEGDRPLTELTVRLNALAPGDVELRVLADGHLSDVFALVIAEAAELRIFVDRQAVEPDAIPEFSVTNGGRSGHELSYGLFDAEGHRLSIDEMPEWQVDDPEIAMLDGYDGMQYVQAEKLSAFTVNVDTDSIGESTIHARAHGIEGTLNFRVIGDKPGVITLPAR